MKRNRITEFHRSWSNPSCVMAVFWHVINLLLTTGNLIVILLS